MKMPEPVAWMYEDCGSNVLTFFQPRRIAEPLFTEAQLREVINSAAQICQRWINDHSKADNCTYNDCDMVAAVTDVMNEIKGMRKLND